LRNCSSAGGDLLPTSRSIHPTALCIRFIKRGADQAALGAGGIGSGIPTHMVMLRAQSALLLGVASCAGWMARGAGFLKGGFEPPAGCSFGY
jgi:hypothetical protein